MLSAMHNHLNTLPAAAALAPELLTGQLRSLQFFMAQGGNRTLEDEVSTGILFDRVVDLVSMTITMLDATKYVTRVCVPAQWNTIADRILSIQQPGHLPTFRVHVELKSAKVFRKFGQRLLRLGAIVDPLVTLRQETQERAIFFKVHLLFEWCGQNDNNSCLTDCAQYAKLKHTLGYSVWRE